MQLCFRPACVSNACTLVFAVEKCKQEGIALPSSQASLHGAEALLAQSLDRRSLMMVLAVCPWSCMAMMVPPAIQLANFL